MRSRVAVVAGVAVLGSWCAPATSVAAREPYAHRDSGFEFRLLGAAVQAPDAGLGHSSVRLRKSAGADYGKCDAVGAAVHLDDVFRRGLLENSGPPDAGPTHVYNPTAARDRAPNLQPGDGFPAHRGGLLTPVRDALRILEYRPEGVLSSASCESDVSGAATGNHVEDVGFDAAGHTSTGRVDKETGEYEGVSRAFVAGLATRSGVVDLVSSTVRITQLPNRQPVVDYLVAVNGKPVAEDRDVPFDELAGLFPEPAAVPFGLTLFGPTETASDDSPRYVVHFPFLEVSTGEETLRLLTHTYEGTTTTVTP